MGNPLVYHARAAHPEGFNPFDPDLAGTLREVRAWLDQAPRPAILSDTMMVDAQAIAEVGSLVDRALRRVGA